MSYISLNELDFLHVSHPGYNFEVDDYNAVRITRFRKSANWQVVTVRWDTKPNREERVFFDFGEAERAFNDEIRKLSAELAVRALDLDSNQT